MMFVFIMAEVFLRMVPIPGVEMLSGVFDPEINLYKYTPNSKVIKINSRNERIIRKVNSHGYLDKNHSIKKPEEVFRIGFFGDSYVVSRQVFLEKTFFRLIETQLSDANIETMAFGRDGHGMLHAAMKSKKYSQDFNLDMVVYVFCENDIGDQIASIKQYPLMPYAELKNNNIFINDDLLRNHLKSQRRRVVDKFKKFLFYNNSILIQTVYRRVNLLRQHGISLSTKASDFNMSSKADANKPPGSTDLPSTWNTGYKKEALSVAERVLLDWYEDVSKDAKNFAVLYIPRQSEWKKKESEQDSWKSWLKTYCKNNEIDFIDPTKHFLRYSSKKGKIYDDHFSELGHIAFAESFIDWYRNKKME